MPASDPSPPRIALIRLPGRAARLRVDGSPGGTLWLAPHHLLQVQTGALREGYRRFAYRDIQSIGVRRTVRGRVYNVFAGLAAMFFGALALAIFSFRDDVSEISVGGVLGGVSVLLLVLFIVNLFRGPTVRAELRTAVGIYPLPSLSRMRPAQRALDLIRQRVDAAQGTLSPEVLNDRVARLTQPPPAPVPVAPAPIPVTSFAPTPATTQPTPGT